MSENENKVLEFDTQNKVEIEIVDQNYRLAEMADAMEQSIANAKKVAKEQKGLVDIVTKSEFAKEYADFAKSCEKQIDDINSQITTLNVRVQLLRKVVKSCEENEDVSKVVSMTLKALGVFENN